MPYRSFFMLVLLMAGFCLPSTAQTFKRKPKGKATAEKPAATMPAANPAKVTKPVTALPEEAANTNPDRITTHELKRKLDAKEDIVILDNRTGSAWIGSQVKIKGAVHLPLQELLTSLDKLPKDKEIITYCT